jgi:ferredoxin
MRVSADQRLCCGSGNCVLIAPEVFGQTEDEGIVVVLRPEPAPGLQPSILEAARVCPTRAITLTEAAGHTGPAEATPRPAA